MAQARHTRCMYWLSLTDFLPMVLEADDAARWPQRTLEVARLLKDAENPAALRAAAAPAHAT